MKRLISLSILLSLGVMTWPFRVSAQFLFSPEAPKFPPFTPTECATFLGQFDSLKQSPKTHSTQELSHEFFTLGSSLEDCDELEEAMIAYRLAHQEQPSYHQFMVRVLVRQNKLSEAVQQSYSIVPSDPSNPFTQKQRDARAMNYVGTVLAKTGQISQAQSYFKQAIQLDPSHHLPYGNLGEIYVKANKLDLATQMFRQEIKINSPSVLDQQLNGMAALRVASALKTQGDRTNAKEWLHKAIEAAPSSGQAYYRLSDLLIGEKDDDQAIAILEKWAQINPSDLNVNNGIGFIYVNRKDYDQAIQYYNKALSPDFRRELKNPEVYIHSTLGNQLSAMARYADAAKAFERVAELDPAYVLNFYYWGDSLAKLQRWEEAIHVFEQGRAALRSNSKDQPSLEVNLSFELANALAKVNRVEEAKALLTPLLETHPKDPTLYQSLAQLYTQEGSLSKASNLIQKSVKNGGYWWLMSTPEAKAYAAQGQALTKLGQHQKALPYFEQAIATDPKFALAYAEWGKSLRYQNRLDKSVSAYQTAIQIDPRDEEVTHSFFSGLGLTLLAQNKLEEADDAFKQALTYYDKNIEAQHGLGVTKVKQGQIEEAIAAFKQVLEIEPHHGSAQSDLRKAQQLLVSHPN